jgi:hypothetical protein
MEADSQHSAACPGCQIHSHSSGDDLPTVVKLLKVHRGVADNLGIRTRELDAPPRQCKSQVRLEEFNLDAAWINEPHGATIRIAVHVRIVKLLPAVKLLRIDHNQISNSSFRRKSSCRMVRVICRISRSSGCTSFLTASSLSPITPSLSP